ncbi:MAG TPA: sulfurtransferase complex subunit TusB, partial [Spongiibacteraceae bacterium]|nr:sulfurtransferase complex subunit TusB [Spongiibacteraceae bacterium]
NRSPFSHSSLANCLSVCDSQASILLIEDGVYAALSDGEWLARILEKTARVYVLDADVAARGLSAKIAAAFARVDYTGFVQLCCEHPSTHSWY